MEKSPMPITQTTPQDTPRKTATLAALNCSRWKLWDLCRNDPDFPKPRYIAGKNQWFGSEIEDYKATRPHRRYADSAA